MGVAVLRSAKGGLVFLSIFTFVPDKPTEMRDEAVAEIARICLEALGYYAVAAQFAVSVYCPDTEFTNPNNCA